MATPYHVELFLITSQYLQLGVGPPGNLDNHVEDVLGLVGVQGNVVERRHDLTLLILCSTYDVRDFPSRLRPPLSSSPRNQDLTFFPFFSLFSLFFQQFARKKEKKGKNY